MSDGRTDFDGPAVACNRTACTGADRPAGGGSWRWREHPDRRRRSLVSSGFRLVVLICGPRWAFAAFTVPFESVSSSHLSHAAGSGTCVDCWLAGSDGSLLKMEFAGQGLSIRVIDTPTVWVKALGRSIDCQRDDELTPTTRCKLRTAPLCSGSRSASKACINPARTLRPPKMPLYAPPPRAQRRDPYPLPRSLGPTPRCFLG